MGWPLGGGSFPRGRGGGGSFPRLVDHFGCVRSTHARGVWGNVLKLGLASTFRCGVRVALCDRALRYMRVNGDAAHTICDKGQRNRHLDIETSQLPV